MVRTLLVLVILVTLVLVLVSWVLVTRVLVLVSRVLVLTSRVLVLIPLVLVLVTLVMVMPLNATFGLVSGVFVLFVFLSGFTSLCCPVGDIWLPEFSIIEWVGVR